MARYSDQMSREPYEAFEIKEIRIDCVSDTSALLSAKEYALLQKGLHRS